MEFRQSDDCILWLQNKNAIIVCVSRCVLCTQRRTHNLKRKHPKHASHYIKKNVPTMNSISSVKSPKPVGKVPSNWLWSTVIKPSMRRQQQRGEKSSRWGETGSAITFFYLLRIIFLISDKFVSSSWIGPLKLFLSVFTTNQLSNQI